MSIIVTNRIKCLLLLAFSILLLDDGFNNTYSNSLSHITNSKTSKRSIFREGLNNHGLGGLKGYHACITVLNELRVGFHGLTGTAIHLLVNVLELGGDVGGVAIENWAVTVLDLTRVRHDDNLGGEGFNTLGWIISVVRAYKSSLDVLYGNVLTVETNVVSGNSLGKRFMMHLYRLNLSGKTRRGEAYNHSGLKYTGLNTSYRHSTDTTNLVYILKRKTKRLVSRSLGRVDGVKSLKKDRTLVPGHVGGSVDHVITNPSRDRNEVDLSRLVSNLL